MSKTWLVTGANRGLGLAIVRTALAAGDRVIATARDVIPLDGDRADNPHTLQTFALDVRNERSAQAAVEFSVQSFGRIDVLVNNAGYGRVAPFETMSDDDFRDQVETNLFGVANLMRAVLPLMRRQRSGHIVNVSSVGGRVSTAGLSAYQAAKWAVSGLTEVIAKEVAGFGVRAISLEPGGMRTGWGSGATGDDLPIEDDYQSSVGESRRRLRAYSGHEVADPAKIARVILDLTNRLDLPDHLILGSDALAAFAAADQHRNRQAESWIEVSKSVDF